MKKMLFVYGGVALVLSVVTFLAWTHWDREWGIFWAGILICCVVIGGPINVIASFFMEGVHEVSRRNQYERYEGEYDVYPIRNGYPGTNPSGTAKVEYLSGGKLKFIYTEKRGNIWGDEVVLNGKNTGVMHWRFRGRAGSDGPIPHQICDKQIHLEECFDANDELVDVIYVSGIPRLDSENDLLIPKGRLPKRSQPIRTVRRFRPLGEMGESRSEISDPSMG